MYSVLKSYGLNGLNGFAVAVEADVSGGLPAFSLVGLPDSAVRESGDRVRSAVKNLGYKWPDRHITVNLAPADIRKSGPVYDLPLLLAVLASSGQMEEPPADAAFLGELALDGSLRPVSGVLPMALAAAADGIRSLYVPAENAAEAAEAGGDAMQVYPARTAREVVDALRGLVPLSPAAPIPFDPASGWNAAPDFADVMGQPLARRAMVLAAAGGHNVLLIGAPGTGKSMLAKRLPGILPPLTREEAVETTKIYSIAGQLPKGRGLISARPFRSPHHSASAAALAGGGTTFRPGECSLADCGAQRRAVSGRAAGVFPGQSGSSAPAAGGRPDHCEPRGRQRHLPQPVPAGGRHEPLQVRLLRPPHPPLHLFPQCGAVIPQPGVRPPAGPHRPLCGDGPRCL